MKLKIAAITLLLGTIGHSTLAQDQAFECQGDGSYRPQLTFHQIGATTYEASVMTYGSNNILPDPFAHLGVLADPIAHLDEQRMVTFHGLNGIEFHVYVDTGSFFVTVPAFGTHLKTSKGECEPLNPSAKFRFEVLSIRGTKFVFSSTSPNMASVHLYNEMTSEKLSCNVDIDIQRFDVIDADGNVVASEKPSCRTNLGGVLSLYLEVRKAGNYTLKAVPYLSEFAASEQKITVN